MSSSWTPTTGWEKIQELSAARSFCFSIVQRWKIDISAQNALDCWPTLVKTHVFCLKTAWFTFELLGLIAVHKTIPPLFTCTLSQVYRFHAFPQSKHHMYNAQSPWFRCCSKLLRQHRASTSLVRPPPPSRSNAFPAAEAAGRSRLSPPTPPPPETDTLVTKHAPSSSPPPPLTPLRPDKSEPEVQLQKILQAIKFDGPRQAMSLHWKEIVELHERLSMNATTSLFVYLKYIIHVNAYFKPANGNIRDQTYWRALLSPKRLLI